MSSRDAIFEAIRRNRPAGDFPHPVVPLFDDAPPQDLRPQFIQTLQRMGGKLSEPRNGDPFADLKDMQAQNPGKILSVVPEFQGDTSLEDNTLPADLADVEIGVVRAAFGVAETGSVCFTDRLLKINTLGYLPQHLFVLLDPAKIVFNLHNAYKQPEFREGHYAVFHTGPSATADIEGVLIRGAQGVRSLNVIFMPG
ncbi:lactate utilization protein [Acetobacter sp. AN02]|uniref:LutC/YkgG family protein n=1 Tax=Acetobacter sp. AN02 TaxID=2894186 RepID=UPI0024344AB2|nr:LUD domain-containing protein [Acetobacter sp. AN02]MDG6094121.1 lactate utilization protein [Acetobacter sp. AN02]